MPVGIASAAPLSTPVLVLLLAACGGGGGGGGGGPGGGLVSGGNAGNTPNASGSGTGSNPDPNAGSTPDPAPSGGSGNSVPPPAPDPPGGPAPAGQTAPPPAPAAHTPVSGRVYDGPVRGAQVYVDVNGDGARDDGDILIAATDNEGRFSGTVPVEHADKPILAVLDGAVDIGNPDVEGDERPVKGTWRAPPESRVISPLTELQVQMQEPVNDILDLPEEVDVTLYDPWDEGNAGSATAQQVAVAGAAVANYLSSGASGPPAPEDIDRAPESHGLAPVGGAITLTPGAQAARHIATLTIHDDGLGTNIPRLTRGGGAWFEFINLRKEGGNDVWELWVREGVAVTDLPVIGYAVDATGIGGNVVSINIGLEVNRLAADTVLPVNVAPVNNPPTGAPTITSSGSLAAPKAGDTLTASAAAIRDEDGLGAFNWQWQSSVDGGSWDDIGADSAVYELTSAEAGRRVRVVVSWTDGGAAPESVASAATVAVAADAVFNPLPDDLRIAENVDGSAPGAAVSIGSPVTAVDANGDAVTYHLFGAAGVNYPAGFAIGETTGRLSYAGNGLDHEALPTLQLGVIARSTGAEGASKDVLTHVDITIGNANDAPVLAASGTASVAENVAVRTVTGVTFSVSDQDDADTHSFTVYEDEALTAASVRFAVEDVGEAGSEAPTLVLLAGHPLDHEAAEVVNNRITLYVVARDNSGAGNAASEKVAVEVGVTDANDAPVLAASGAASVAENVAVRTVTGVTFSVSDQDAGGTHTFTVYEDAALTAVSIRFAVEDVGGSGSEVPTLVLLAGHPLDHEDADTVTLHVVAADGSGTDTAASEKLAVGVTVRDANDAPVLTAGSDELTVDENIGVDTDTAITFTVTDDDDTVHSFRVFEGTETTESTNFAVVGRSGTPTLVLLAGNGLDYEAEALDGNPTIPLRVVVSDGDADDEQTDEVRVTVTVLDANDAPVLAASGTAEIEENVAVRTVTGVTFSVSDQDGGGAHTFTVYEDEGLETVSTRFAVEDVGGSGSEAPTLVLLAGNPLDHEAAEVVNGGITLYVVAADGSGTDTAASEKVAVAVGVTDANDAPVLAASGAASVAENVGVRTVTGVTFSVSDQDAGGTHTFTVYEDAALTAVSIRFAVEDVGGSGSEVPTLVLLAGHPLDHEDADTVTLHVVAVDGSGAGNAASEKLAVKVTVEDGNDAPAGVPTITSSGSLAAPKEGDTLTADAGGIEDEDGLGAFSWQWQSSADGAAWTDAAGTGADSATYELTSAEAGRQVRVVVSYTDGGRTPESVESAATVAVAADAVFNAVPDDLRIAENADGSAPGAAVNTGSRVTAEDANGDTITYSLDSASLALGFAIESGTGQISYAGTGLDYEAQAAHTLTVTATSIGADGTPAGVDQAVTVRVVNIVEATEDADYVFDADDFGFAIGAGASLASVTIRPLALPAGASLQLNGSDVVVNQVIRVDQIGNLVFTPAADANGADYAGFTFRANDGARNSAVETMRIDVDPVNDAPTASGSTIAVNENNSHTFAAGDFGFADVDGDALASVAIATLPANGALALDGTAVSAGDAIAVADIGNLVFTPDANENGAGYGDFTFKVNDGREDSAARAAMTINVVSANGPNSVTIVVNYENHPLNKHVYDADPEGTRGGAFTLPAGVHDNGLFTVDDNGRLWWRAMPDYEAPGDGNGDNVYRVRISHSADGGEATHSHLDIAVRDVLLEEDDTSHYTRRTTGVDYFRFSRDEIPDAEEPTGLVRHLMSGRAFIMPATGPLVLTWSFAQSSSLLETQADVETARSLMERALAEFEAAANIRFIEVGADDDTGVRGDIRVNLHKTTSGHSAEATYPGGGITNSNYMIVGTPSLHDGFLYQALIHELGHAMGLSHPFDPRNGWPGDEDYLYSTDTIMSYATDTDYEDAGLPFDPGLREADIEALRFLYGAPGTDWQSPERFFATSPASRIEFTSVPSGYTHIEVDENIDASTIVYDVPARGVPGREIAPTASPLRNFELQAGYRDNDLFTIDADDGELRFRQSPDYENPHDGPNDPKFGGNNIYEVKWRAEFDWGIYDDGTYATHTRAAYLLIEVQDVVEII